MDDDFGHLDDVKAAQSSNEEDSNGDKHEVKATLGQGEEPKQSDVTFYVQTAWSAFVSALAADDLASASSILFGPDAVTLMAPGADSVTLATEQEKANLLNDAAPVFKLARLEEVRGLTSILPRSMGTPVCPTVFCDRLDTPSLK
ncbi:unnamed protein product [Closterium sp. NIES-65]|nr:unnamed protein product [Closterium sp. NIES-65]